MRMWNYASGKQFVHSQKAGRQFRDDGEFKDSFKQTKMIVIMIDWIYTVRF